MRKILLFTSILFLTFTTSLLAQHPTVLVASNVTSTSVDLNWDASACGTSVNLRYREVGGSWNPNINLVTSPHLLSGLLTNTDYEWTVKCVGTSGWQTPEFFTTLVSPPTIANAFISQPILCADSLGGLQLSINNLDTATFSCIVGYYNGPPGYFVSYVSTNQTTVSLINLPGFNPNIDYCIRIVDSAVYYNANALPNGNGSASGFSTTGVYDEFCPINFSEPAQLVASTSVVASNLCVGDCIAAEDLLISGGAGPYSFTVNGGAPQNLASGVSTYSFVTLCANNYNIIVTDSNGCSTSPSTTTFIIAPITIIMPGGTMSLFNLNGYHVSCNGASDGIITAAATGGTGIFTYSKDGVNFQSSATFSSLSAGTYTITYKDSNGCTTTEQLTLIEPPALVGATSITQVVDCFGSSTGEITFTVDPAQPGVPTYQYSIDSGANSQSSNIFSNLTGNLNYDVMIEDNNQCQYYSSIYLAEPTQIIYSTILSNYNSYEVSCNDSSNGSIEFTSPIGGVPPYTYSIDGSGTFSSITIYSDLSSGIYNIEVKDFNGCIASSFDTLNKPGIFSLALVSNTIDCFGNCNGEIVINPLNGVGQIMYDIDGGTQVTTASFLGLCGDITNGSYIVNAVDANGCIADTTISISEPTDFVYTTNSTSDYCYQSNGQASITVTSGGSGVLSYIWNNDPLEIDSVADSLVAGIYTVLVTDTSDCSFSESVTVLADIAFSVSFTNVYSCVEDSSGSATVTATGESPYSYQWSDSLGIIAGANDSSIIGMPIGTYSVLVTDATSCVIAGSVDIISPVDPIVIDSVVVTNSSCFGIDDAQIEIFASGGPQPYSYSNTNGLNTLPNPVFDSLAPITYTFQAIDVNGCFDDTSITLSYPDQLAIDSTVFTHISCFGLDDGAVQNIQFVGGTGPFEFAIDGGIHQTYMLFSGLEPGQHTVEVFDVNNCASSDFITIIEPTLFEVETTASNWNNYQIRCNGDSLGYVDIISSGGTAPYLTDGITFSNTITIDSLWAGNHTFVVQDANGCPYQETILFNEPDSIQHNFISTHINCAAWNNGSVTDSVYGGVGSATTYSYLWDSGETTYSLANLTTGTYTITVTDENGCEDTESVIINDDNVFETNQGAIENVGCFDDCDGELNVTVLGGVPFTGLTSYTYFWNDYLGQSTALAVGLCVDSITLSSDYYCVVSDAVGCSDTVHFILTQPEELQIDVLITDSIDCKGFSDGELKAIVTGGEPNYTYTWSNGVTFNGGISSTISSLPLGIYKVIVEDANMCRDTFEIYLKEPDSVEIFSIQEFDISCFGDDDGSIEVLGIGGTSFELTYSYSLYLNGIQDANVVDYQATTIDSIPYTFPNLVPGNYYVIAKDRNGCEVTSLSVEITEPFEPLTLLVDTVDETCLLNDGIIRIFPEGGSQSFNYFINGTPTLNNSNIIGGNAPGWYAITVIDTRGCEITDSTFIKSYRSIFMNPDSVAFIDTTICLGQSITIDVDESSELTYTWNDGVETGDRIIMPEVILAQGENATVYYTLTITDANDCQQQNVVVVNFSSIDPMPASNPGVEFGVYPIVLAGDNINLFSENNNCIEYTWQWSNDTITNANGSITIQELSETDWYYLNVKDADGCLGYDSIYIVVGVKPYEAITPNNDGFNDTWTPLDIGSYQNALVQVFNRWGGLVFESIGGIDYVAWDGTNNGKELAVGTYYYIIDLNTGDEPQTGPVTIIR